MIINISHEEAKKWMWLVMQHWWNCFPSNTRWNGGLLFLCLCFPSCLSPQSCLAPLLPLGTEEPWGKYHVVRGFRVCQGSAVACWGWQAETWIWACPQASSATDSLWFRARFDLTFLFIKWLLWCLASPPTYRRLVKIKGETVHGIILHCTILLCTILLLKSNKFPMYVYGLILIFIELSYSCVQKLQL